MKKIVIAVFLCAMISFGAGISSNSSNPIYWTAYDSSITVLHFGRLDSGHTISSGLDHFRHFSTEDSLELHVDSLKGEGWYAEQKGDQE